MSDRQRPLYVDFGGITTTPSPYACEGAALTGFVLKGDHARLQRLCEAVFTQPSGGRVDVQPWGPYVMLTFGIVARVSPVSEPHFGYTTERQVAFWVPAVVTQRNRRGITGRSVACFVPYIWVDNPLSLAGGREVYGFPKSWGAIGLAGPGERRGYTLRTFGGDAAPDECAGLHALLEVRPAARAATPGQGWRWSGVEDALGSLVGAVRERVDEVIAPELQLEEDFLARELGSSFPPLVFLKQFRSAYHGADAASQQIVEAPLTVERLAGAPLPGAWRFSLHDVASHPVEADLGVATQTPVLAFHAELNFVMERGRLLWSAARELPHALPASDLVESAMAPLLAAFGAGVAGLTGLLTSPARAALRAARSGVSLTRAMLRGEPPPPPELELLGRSARPRPSPSPRTATAARRGGR
jgi:hypothetical protein